MIRDTDWSYFDFEVNYFDSNGEWITSDECNTFDDAIKCIKTFCHTEDGEYANIYKRYFGFNDKLIGEEKIDFSL